MRKFLLLGLLLLGACNAVAPVKQGAASAESERAELPIPGQYQQAVTQAEVFGTEIFMQDIAAWSATDFLVAKGVMGADKRLLGWIAEHADNIVANEKMKVIFVGEVEGETKGLYQIEVDAGKVIENTFLNPPAGFQLTENQRSMFKARTAAAQSGFTPCSKSYNTAVFKYGDESGSYTVVYLLAGTSVPGEVMIGGNYRILLNQAGDKVLENKPLSKSCLAMQKKEGVAALTITHLVEPVPNAVHVFLSILHQTPIYVRTVDNGITWRVEGNTISVVAMKN